MDVLEEIQKLTHVKNVEENKITEDDNKILINYVIRRIWNWTNLVVNNIFAYNVALHIIFQNEDLEQNLLKNVNIEKISLCGKKQLRQKEIHFQNVKFLD